MMLEKFRKYNSIVIPVLIFVGLIAFSKYFSDSGSKELNKRLAGSGYNSLKDSIQGRFNYSKGDEKFSYTFLEFGAKNCYSCKKMEKVMDEVREKYPEKVNVVFVDVTLEESQSLIKYFGVSNIPFQVVLDENAEEIYRHTGFISTDDLSLKFK